jgi:hypothetical protein
MTLEEASTALPWLEIHAGRGVYNLVCTVCKGMETFSALMLRDQFLGDIMQVKAVRYHLYCGKTTNKQYVEPEVELPSVEPRPVRLISLTDE